MPIPVNRLKSKYNLDPDSLKAAFDVNTLEKRPKVKKLVNQIRDTIQGGINRNRSDYKLYKAMDWAYDTPFYQVSYTQLRGLISSSPDEKKVMETVNSWGLTHLLPDKLNKDGTACCGADGKPMKALNLPVFFNIFVPIVMSYITIRWAKLFNDRNLIPTYKYEPVTFTRDNRFRCEVITQLVQRQSVWFDYPADIKQSILQTLLYGFCINFPREAWYVERQETEEGKEEIVREGLRWNMPHPSRTYYDLYHRLSSLNSNSGCEYAGYWELCRYRDIYDNPLYWNKERITMGATSWFDLNTGGTDFLQQVFPCVMSFPNATGDGAGGVGALDRQNEAARTYGQGEYDNATLLTQHFQKLVPADYGLGKYKNPVWMRFVFASDNAVVWAEPLAFSVLPTYTYDADFNRARFRSLALEIIPFQDHISNLLTQWILAVKDNLVNPVFYDKEKIPANYVQELQNLGQKILNGRLFIPFESTPNYRMKVEQRDAFFSPQLTHHNTAELANLVAGVLNMLDRIMQLSPQEIGQTAPHEQTAEETRVIAQNTSTRVIFTGTGIDAGDNAKKTACYDALMAHADDDITVSVSSSFATTQAEFDKLLKAVGFELTDKEAQFDPEKPEMMHQVKGNKSHLAIEEFSSTRENETRINLPAIADAMSKIFVAIAGNPVLIQAIGPPQLVELLNQIIVTSGLPQEFRLRGKPMESLPQEQQAQQVAQMMKEFAGKTQELVAAKQQETLQLAQQQSAQMVAQAVQAVQQQAQQQAAQAAAGVGQALQQAAPAIQAAQQATQVAAQKITELEQVAAQQQQEIVSLNQALSQLTEAVQQAQMVGGAV